MSEVSATHMSLEGYVFPTDVQTDHVLDATEHALRRIPEEHQIDSYMLGEIAVDMGFEHGWYHGQADDVAAFLISRDARDAYDEQVPYIASIDDYLVGNINLASRLGDQACKLAYQRIMDIQE